VNRFVSAHDFTGCGRKAGAPRPWCWGRGNRAQRAAFSCVSGHDLQSFRQRSIAPRQGSPHSKKLNLTPRAVVQLNSGPQLLSTVSETKTGRHRCPAPPWQTGPRLQGTTSNRAESDQTALQLAEKSPRSTPPGSPHSKKLSLKPCAVVELNSGPQLLSTVSEPKRDAARAPLRFGKLAPGASARLDLACSERSAATGAPDTPVVGVTGWQRARFWHDGVEKARSRMGAENDQIRFGALAPEG
jgi:hypothetical protein